MHRRTILIAEDDFAIREGALRPRLADDFRIVASVANGMEAVAAAKEHKPDIALLDVSLPGMRGFEAARRILADQPGCKVLFVSSHTDAAFVEAAEAMGASGYVMKSRVLVDLQDAISTALSGRFYRPPGGL